ncbi:MAG: hypothetical protein LBQ06_06960, partial [Frankiaceae bacterium]|nr:hypothetical protein [Frankiaceae bacterium]
MGLLLVALGMVALNQSGSAGAAAGLDRAIDLKTFAYTYTGKAQMGVRNGGLQINPNWLYQATPGDVYQLSNMGPDGTLNSADVVKLVDDIKSNGSGFSNEALDSMAIDGARQMFYFWNHEDHENNAKASDIGGATPPDPKLYDTVWAVPAGSDHPSKVYFVPASNSTGGGNGTGHSFEYGWAGGEVQQSTGYIYFSGGNDAYLGYTGPRDEGYQVMIFDPQTGAYNVSDYLQPATPADAFSGDLRTKVSGDLAIDAAGDAFTVVKTDGGNGGLNTAWLIKITPGPSGHWTYSRVAPLYESVDGRHHSQTLRTNDVAWGLAYLNGQIYADNIGQGDHDEVFRIDPRTGIVTRLPSETREHVTDFSSAQSVAVVTGTVYYDANGNGKVDAGEGPLPCQLVQLYSSDGTLIGEQATNGEGQYSFMVPGSGDVYVRVPQPQVNGVNAVQTFANAVSKSGDNSATVYPANGRPAVPYVDPAPPSLDKTDIPLQVDLGKLPAYVQVHVTSDKDVTTANFGVSASGSWGDAPAGYRSTNAQSGPRHAEGDTPNVYLGSQTGFYADGTNDNSHPTDDGVTLKVGSFTVPANQQVLASG